MFHDKMFLSNLGADTTVDFKDYPAYKVFLERGLLKMRIKSGHFK